MTRFYSITGKHAPANRAVPLIPYYAKSTDRGDCRYFLDRFQHLYGRATKEKMLATAVTAALAEHTYRRYVRTIYRFCLYRTNSSHDAEDVTTEVFIKLLAGKADGVADGRLPAWLFKVAENECRALHRRRRRRHEVALDEIEPLAVDGTPWASPHLCAAINRLKPLARQVLFLKAVEDLTFRQTASLLGVSEGAAKMAFYRGVKRLARTLRNGGNHDLD